MIRKPLEGQMIDHWRDLGYALWDCVDSINKSKPNSVEMPLEKELAYTVYHRPSGRLTIELDVPHRQTITYAYVETPNVEDGIIHFEEFDDSVVMTINGESMNPDTLAKHLLRPFTPADLSV